MSYKRNTDTAIAYVNRHVPQMTKEEMDNLDPEMFEFVLSEIRRHFKEFYENPKPKKYPDFDREMFGAYGPSLRGSMFWDRMRMYERRGPIGGEIPVIVDEVDYSGIESRVMATLSAKRHLVESMVKMSPLMKEAIAEVQKKMWADVYPPVIEESHYLKPEDLYIRERVRPEAPKLGAGKNPFAEHTIRGMKGKRK